MLKFVLGITVGVLVAPTVNPYVVKALDKVIARMDEAERRYQSR